VTGPGGAQPVVLPMFPLQTVLFPSARLPLQIFEPRYLAMTRELLAGDRRFGVVLIARGPEVGGGDERTATGTVAVVDRVGPLPAGRIGLLAHGTERLRVERWLPDDPFPRAEVRLDLDELGAAPSAELVRRAEVAERRALALRSELGEGPAWPAGQPLPSDPRTAAWTLCDVAPLGLLDRQRLLEVDDADDRVRLLVLLVDAAAQAAARQLSLG
jgi:Lon protease-like protein